MTPSNNPSHLIDFHLEEVGEDRVVAAGLLLALVLLLAFGVTVSHLVGDAERTKIAGVVAQRDRMDCDQHALAVTRNACQLARQSPRMLLSTAGR